MLLLEDRVAIVTGAGSGIAKAGAEALARHGAHVVLGDRDPDAVEVTAEAIRSSGGSALAVPTDVTNDKQLVALVEKAAGLGRIDILFSHVGLQAEGTLEQVAIQGMDASWAINVRSHFILARAVVPHMREQGGGSVIITSSGSGIQYDDEMIAYATTKHASVAMVRQMAKDYGHEGIRFNALCPGWVDTPFNEPIIRQMGGREALDDYLETRVPMRRWARAEEIADGVVYLASDMSSFVTGLALVIDGGESI